MVVCRSLKCLAALLVACGTVSCSAQVNDKAPNKVPDPMQAADGGTSASCDRLAGQTVEAEDYDAIEAPMAIEKRTDASGGEYLAGSANGGGSASYRFSAPRAGTYWLWARVAADNDQASTLSATLDQDNPITFTFPAGRTWHWTRADESDDTAISLDLTEGCHTLTLTSPKGAAVDKWLITDDPDSLPAIRRVIDVGPVWTGVQVGFAFLTHGDQQYIAYYNSDRQLAVGQRTLGQSQFQLKTLPNVFGGWDAHNGITLALDSEGQIHLAGDMHTSPLVYFRTTVPGDITTLTRASMVGTDESSVTYPAFLTLGTGQMLFRYREGGSGNGDWYWDIYDPKSHSWSRWLSKPLFGGTSTSISAYPVGPQKGPDGKYHMVWVWRDSSDASTNHDLSYASSPDLRHWQAADGTPLTLPITLAQKAAVVDPVPVHGGLVNGQTRLGWDAQGRVTVSYLKYDADGNSQVYTARREGNAWKIYQTTSWSWRWAFSGTGALPTLIRVGGVTQTGDELVEDFWHWKAGSGRWTIDPATLQPTGVFQLGTEIPPELNAVETPRGNLPAAIYSDMNARFLTGHGDGPRGGRYFLRWEALAPTNRDHPRMCGSSVCVMPPSMMQLYELND